MSGIASGFFVRNTSEVGLTPRTKELWSLHSLSRKLDDYTFEPAYKRPVVRQQRKRELREENTRKQAATAELCAKRLRQYRGER